MVLQYLHQEIVIISYLSNFLIRWMFPFLAACQYYSVILFGFRLIKTCIDQNHHHKDTLGTHSKKNYGIIWEFFP